MADETSERPDPGLEPVEELDASGRVIRVVNRAEMRAENLLHRMVAVVVIRPGGRIVVHQRAAWKDLHPSKWDVAFGGVPNVGEADTAAATRELHEEAGLRIEEGQLVHLAALDSADEHTRWHGRFYLVTTDENLAPNDGEVVALAEVAFDDLEEWASATPLCDDTLHTVMPMLLATLGGPGWESVGGRPI